MSERRLVIHAGFHKSGTTALQESFDAQSEELKEHGVIYPNIGRKAHHRVAWALTQRTWGWSKRGGERTSRKYWTDLAKSVNSSNAETIVISSEFFSELDGDAIRTISNEIRNRKIQVLFTVRPLVKLLGSSYQQYLKYGIKADYTTWLHSVLDNPGESKINPTFWMRHFHGKVVARWVDVVGPQNVSVIIVDESNPEFLFDSVNAYLGLPKSFLKAQETGSNRSLTMEEIALLIEINKRFPKDREWDEYEVFIRDGYVRRLTDHIKPSADSGKLPTPAWAIQKGNEVGAQNKAELIATGAKIIGDIDSLDSAQVLEGEPVYPEKISIALIAEAMIGFDKHLVKRFPLDWVQSNIFNRYRRKIKIEINKVRKKL
ncbi:MAG: hypothetical protein FGM47_01955 [Candidatus Nanopelagicaceae bacterium]|nr:hypothetical protein [Candidatus Nanopelagicaceae bacterium]